MVDSVYRVEAWPIAGRSRVVHIWPDGPGTGWPRSAILIGGVGWVDVRPQDEVPPVGAEASPRRFERNRMIRPQAPASGHWAGG